MANLLETYEYDNLVLANPKTRMDTIKSGNSGVRGQAMAIETSSQLWVLYKDGGTGGQEIFRGILAETVDASGGNTDGLVYIGGEFNENQVVLHSDDEMSAEIRNEAQHTGITLRHAQAAAVETEIE